MDEREREQTTKVKRERPWIKWTVGISLSVIICIGIVLTVVTFLIPVKIKQPIFTYEFGSEVSTELTDYVEGNSLALRVTRMDMSNVEPEKVGRYSVTVSHGPQTETFRIVIEDTTPPELTLKEEPLYLEAGEDYEVDWFVSDVYDLSEKVNLEIALSPQGNGYEKSVCCTTTGDYRLQIRATDIYGNEATGTLDVVADNPPQISGYKDFYVAQGSAVDFGENIVVIDEVDGDLSAELVVDISRVYMNAEGTYEVIYSATDHYGLSAEVPVPVTVLSPAGVQELINTHQINRFDQNIVGAYNLYDGGVYESEDVDFILEEMEPAITVITHTNTRGSGFIVKITDEDIIICTNLHVTNNRDDLTVYFHDGTSAPAVTEGSMDKIDVSFVRVSRADVPQELFDTLKTVHIDKSYLDSITDPKSVKLGFRTLQTSGKVWKDKQGVLVDLKEKFSYQAYASNRLFGNVEYVTQVTAANFSGSSGSAILDGHGNLIAMVSFRFYSGNGGKTYYYGMTVEDILLGYKQIFGEDLNYQ